MRKLTHILWAVVPCAAIFALVSHDRQRTHHELDELRASLPTTEDPGERPSEDLPPGGAREIGRILARAAVAASAKEVAPQPVPAGAVKPPEKRLSQEQVTENVLGSFAKEARDPEWSRQALEKIEGPIREALPPGSRILSTDCRTTMCVVEIEHHDPAAAQSWLLPGLSSWPGAVYIPEPREDNGLLVQTIVPIKTGVTPAYAGLD